MSTHILGDEAPAQPPAAPGDSHRRPPVLMRWMRSFRHWRKGRPFVGGLLAVLAGAELLAAPVTSIGVMIHEGVAGFSASFFGPLLILFGLAVWFAPAYRLFAGIATILLGLIALPTINLGGFFIGTLLALIGGGMSAAWMPKPGWEAPTRKQRRLAQQAVVVATAPGDPVSADEADASTMNAETAEIAGVETEPRAPYCAESETAGPAGYGEPAHAPADPVAEADPAADPAEPTEHPGQHTEQTEADRSGSTEESGAHLEE